MGLPRRNVDRGQRRGNGTRRKHGGLRRSSYAAGMCEDCVAGNGRQRTKAEQ